jgi:phosphotransferase system enzyme I (PtsI)
LGVSGSDLQSKQEARFQGVPVAPGIARGRVIVHWLDDEEIPFRTISAEELPEEIARFESALIATRAELLEIQQRIADAIGTKDAGIFDAHLLVVEDRTLIDEVLRNLEKERHNVEYTFHQVAEKYCRTLGAIDDPYLRERDSAPARQGPARDRHRRQATYYCRPESHPFGHRLD